MLFVCDEAFVGFGASSPAKIEAAFEKCAANPPKKMCTDVLDEISGHDDHDHTDDGACVDQGNVIQEDDWVSGSPSDSGLYVFGAMVALIFFAVFMIMR